MVEYLYPLKKAEPEPRTIRTWGHL
jgi:hypothetical protein